MLWCYMLDPRVSTLDTSPNTYKVMGDGRCLDGDIHLHLLMLEVVIHL